MVEKVKEQCDCERKGFNGWQMVGYGGLEEGKKYEGPYTAGGSE
jgi:hypothetical protein